MLSGSNTEPFDLCIIGAGVAGLNALFVATLYLPETARVVLIDRNKACGGMWTETYDYVRLHQPHTMFTAGDIHWAWDRPADYLATGSEVQSHLNHCLSKLRQKLNLTELFGANCESYSEIITSDGPCTHIRYRHLPGDGPVHTIKARRTINAAGWDIQASKPLQLSSQSVISTTPARLSADDTDPSAPAVIVGGGKTGMDTFLALKQKSPSRKITLINGQGTVFGNRDVLFPRGAARWWQGTMVSALSRDITMRFNGRNTDEVFDYFQKNYALSPGGHGDQYFFSTMSGAELRAIEAGPDSFVGGYLEDVVDSGSGPEIRFRNGTTMAISPGSLVINCTGHLLRHPRAYEPYISQHGTILSVNSRSSVYFLSSSAAYFLTHVFFLGKLRTLPFYELDTGSLLGKCKKTFFLGCLTHSFHNMLVIMGNVPISVFGRCGLDLNRWFPLPRRLAALVVLKVHQKRYIAHCRKNLDHIRREHKIRCGPLPTDETSGKPLAGKTCI